MMMMNMKEASEVNVPERSSSPVKGAGSVLELSIILNRRKNRTLGVRDVIICPP